MVILSAIRPKKLFYLLLISTFTTVLFIFRSKHDDIDPNQDVLPLPAIGVTLPNLNEFNYLTGTAASCTQDSPKLLAFVHSSPTNIPHRDAIRKTWGSASLQSIRTVFLVGRSKSEKVWKKVQQEADEFGDLVLLSFTDSYQNLTLKHLSGLKWITENCPRVPFVLKADDDTFIDTKRLLSIIDIFLGENSGSKDSLICHVIPDGTAPKRSGKWMVTREEYPFEEYPEYCSGLAYFARLATLKKIHDVASSGGVPYLKIDDVYITGLSAALASVRRQDLGVRFANTELPVIEWMKRKTIRPCPWMAVEISPFYWPKEAVHLWNKTILAWEKSKKDDSSVYKKH